MATLDMLERLLVALALGVVIGTERQCRTRMAGLRTNVLVTVGSTLFVLLSGYGFASLDSAVADPTRVAAQIVSGIGFLGAGVIIRDGATVRGLTTAATLWCAAAIGSLAGAGMYTLATAGAGMVMLTNLVLRPISRKLSKMTRTPPELLPEMPYHLEAVCGSSTEAMVRTQLLTSVRSAGFQLRSIRVDHHDNGTAKITAALASSNPTACQLLENAVGNLSEDLLSVEWRMRDLSPV